MISTLRSPAIGILAFAALLLLSVVSRAVHAQEFPLHNNGLIYDSATIGHLHRAVDSLHLKFTSCHIDRPFHSVEQTIGSYVKFSSPDDDLSKVKEAMDAGATFDQIASRFPSLLHDTFVDVVVTRNYDTFMTYRDIEQIDAGEERVMLRYTTPLGDGSRGMMSVDEASPFFSGAIPAGRWIYRYSTKEGAWDSNYNLWAYYLPQEMKRQEIPEHYARLMRYADCLIDTATRISVDLPDSPADEFVRLMKSVDAQLALPPYPAAPADYANKKSMMAYYRAEKRWEKRKRKLMERAGAIPGFADTLRAAAIAGIRDGYSDQDLEWLVEHYVSKELALELMRRRRVKGMCSQDQAPRIHAMHIAMLAAQSGRWDVFLRAHLDVMNDNFSRISDGSYAWGERRTYIRELEALDIDVLDLMLGITIFAGDPHGGHYQGMIWRVGRALSEAVDTEEFERRAYGMMRDPELDDFNRAVLYNLYTSYLMSISSPELRAAKLEVLRSQAPTLPPYLRRQIASLRIKE